MSVEAHRIYQAHLDTVSAAFWDRDFDTLLTHIFFPSFIETDDKVLRMQTPDCYRPSLDSFRRQLDLHGATAYHRICRQAIFSRDDPNRIEGIHETFALNGATAVQEPHLNQMTLAKVDGRWLGVGIRSATRNDNWHIIDPSSPEPSHSDDAKQEKYHD